MNEITKTKPFAITKSQIWQAYKKVRNHGKSAGYDNQDWPKFDINLPKNLYKIWNRMASGSYMPPAIKLVEIPKVEGGARILGVPTVSDRVAQMVVKSALEVTLEPIFHSDSYGFRPIRSAHQALEVTRRRCWDYDWVLKVDIKEFFDTLDHELLMKAVELHTQEAWIILYIKRWLKAPIYRPDGTIEHRSKGVPQGGVISPLLANLYFHYVFDKWIGREHKEARFERYADDIVVHGRSYQQAEQFKQTLAERLQECKLSMHPAKTKIVYCQDEKRTRNYECNSFTFLGYDFRAYRSVVEGTKRVYKNFSCGIVRSATKRLSKNIQSWKLHRRSWMVLDSIGKEINPIVRGWLQYYGKFRKYELNQVFRVLNNQLVKWARKKYKRFRYNGTLAREWVKEQTTKNVDLFEHWHSGFTII